MNPKTIGEKIFNRRLELGLLQSDVASIIGVCTESISNWENNKGEPQIQFYPKVIEFLEYFPFVIDTSTFGGMIKKYRYFKGLSQENFALKLGVNESTIYHYENGIHKPSMTMIKKLELVLDLFKLDQLTL